MSPKKINLKTLFRSKIVELLGIDLRTLALFRIVLGVCILTDLIIRSKDLVAFYSDNGVVPIATLPKTISLWSLHTLNGSWQYQVFLFLLAGIFALFLLVGYKTKMSTVISWILLISLHHRNPILLYAGDNILLLLLFWGTFLPLEARFSLDAVFHNKYDQLNKRFISIASLGILLQVFYVYFFSALHKIAPEWRIDGTAINYALRVYLSQKPLGEFLLRFPLLLKVLTYSVFLLESLGSVLLFSPFFTSIIRLFLVFCFISFHVGIFMSMRLDLFPLFSITSLLIFIPSLFWDKLFAILSSSKQKITIYYDDKCSVCVFTIRIFKHFFLLKDSITAPASKEKEIHKKMLHNNSWVIRDASGNYHYSFEGFIVICQASPLLQFFIPILTVQWIRLWGERIYRFVARNRKKCNIYVQERKHSKSRISTLYLVQGFSTFLLIFITSLNIFILNNIPIPKLVGIFSYSFGLTQGWTMYAPGPYRQNGWYTIMGVLENEKQINLLNQKSPIDTNYPTLQYPLNSDRWMMFEYAITSSKFPRIISTNREVFYNTYSSYLCKIYNDNAKTKLRTVNVYLTTQFIDLNKKNPLYKSWLISYNCFAH